jgi:hypothetical protein
MKRGDVIVALILLALAGALTGVRTIGTRGQGAVYVNGSAVRGDVTVDGVEIEMEAGRARVVSSPCRDKLCVRAGWLERPGDVAVCLPQRVVVEIRGAARNGVDGVAY